MHVGFAILQTSKYEMCLNYGRFKNVFGDNGQHLYTPTDSLKLLTKKTNLYKLKKYDVEDYIDTSSFVDNTILPLEPGKYEKIRTFKI